jgi:hypothetical protein
MQTFDLNDKWVVYSTVILQMNLNYRIVSQK